MSNLEELLTQSVARERVNERKFRNLAMRQTALYGYIESEWEQSIEWNEDNPLYRVAQIFDWTRNFPDKHDPFGK